jgi:hypothetical protein
MPPPTAATATTLGDSADKQEGAETAESEKKSLGSILIGRAIFRGARVWIKSTSFFRLLIRPSCFLDIANQAILHEISNTEKLFDDWIFTMFLVLVYYMR